MILGPIIFSLFCFSHFSSHFFSHFLCLASLTFLIRSSTVLESSPLSFSKLFVKISTVNRVSFSTRSSAIFLWSSPSNFSKFLGTENQYSFSMSSLAISESSLSNFSKFFARASQYLFSIRSFAIF